MVVLTGAGVSMAAGLPSGPELVESALACLSERLSLRKGIASAVSRVLPLEVLFQVIADHAGEEAATAVTRVLDASTPTVTHVWIAEQQRSGRCRSIYTFNFDTLHEQSLGDPFETQLVGRSIVLESLSKEWRLTKLHGSATHRGVVSIGEYVQGFSDSIRHRMMDDWSKRVLLVLGYGGWDVDLRVTLDEAVAKRCLPRAVVWVDRSFPRTGGRTELLTDFEAHGVVCHRVESEISTWLGFGAAADAKAHTAFEYDWRELAPLDELSVGAILAEACLLSDRLDWTAEIATELAGEEASRIEALLQDQKGERASAAAAYRRIVEGGWHGETTRALAAARAFTLSAGQVDLFDQVLPDQLQADMARHFDAFVWSRRSDLGGLARDKAARRVRELPRPFATASGVTSLDAVRLYIGFLTESARLLHEARDFDDALEMDRRALRFASALGDPALVASTSGGVGVCYMGLAEDAVSGAAESHLAEAERWLRGAVEGGRERVGDYVWGLHMCNLGSVLSERGDPRNGVQYLLAGLPVLTAAYPNWAVSCQAYLAMAFGDLFDLECEPKHLRDGLRAVQVGWALANRLKDFDDVHLLKEAEAKLRDRGEQ